VRACVRVRARVCVCVCVCVCARAHARARTGKVKYYDYKNCQFSINRSIVINSIQLYRFQHKYGSGLHKPTFRLCFDIHCQYWKSIIYILRAYTTGGSTQCSESVVSVRKTALYRSVHAFSLAPHAIGT